MADLLPMIRTERLALIDFLETLTPADWAVPSLCDGWTVQDVAAHLASASAMGSVSWSPSRHVPGSGRTG